MPGRHTVIVVASIAFLLALGSTPAKKSPDQVSAGIPECDKKPIVSVFGVQDFPADTKSAYDLTSSSKLVGPPSCSDYSLSFL